MESKFCMKKNQCNALSWGSSLYQQSLCHHRKPWWFLQNNIIDQIIIDQIIIDQIRLDQIRLDQIRLHVMSVIIELHHTKCHNIHPRNKCPKRFLLTTGGQIPIEKHYHSLTEASCKEKLYKFVCGVSSRGGDHEVDQRKIEEQERKQILSSLQQDPCAKYDCYNYFVHSSILYQDMLNM